jgi:hypothetical protein
VTILIIGSVLLGAILGRFFKVPVLAPAFALSLAMVVASSAYFGHSLLRTLLEFVVLITSLQIGYASGLLSRLIPSVSENAGEPRPRLRPHPEPLQPGLCAGSPKSSWTQKGSEESNIPFMWRRHSRRKTQRSAPSFHAGRCHRHPRAQAPQDPAKRAKLQGEIADTGARRHALP